MKKIFDTVKKVESSETGYFMMWAVFPLVVGFVGKLLMH